MSAMDSRHADPLIGRELGGYRLQESIGRGGMAAVYRAREVETGAAVALKVMPLEWMSDPRDAQRFEREAEAASRLHHPQIVGMLGSGRDGGYLYLAMELVEGETLKQRLERDGRLPQAMALGLGAQLLGALAAAHQHGVVHGDIKPANIVVTRAGDLKLLDFGVARLQGAATLSGPGEVTGTPEYMAPEQILGDAVGPEADLYAAGVLLYEVLTGVPPFAAESAATLIYHQLNEEPQAPSARNPHLPRDLDRFILSLLDKLPENRGTSAERALADLERIRRRSQLTRLPGDPEEVTAAQEMRGSKFQPRFVGRGPELEIFDGYRQALGDGGGRVVLLGGEAGVGKTRLLERLDSQARASGARTVWGTCFYGQALGGLMPILDAVGHLFSQTECPLSDDERSSLRQLLMQQAPELATLASSDSTTVKVRAGFAAAFGTEDSPDAARQQLFDTLFDLLAAAGRLRPLVVLLEDIHWADAGTLELLQYLARRAPEAGLLVVATYRPEELADHSGDNGLARMLAQLNIDGRLTEVSLPRLSRDEVLQMARSLYLETDLGDAFGAYLHEQSQGNPFIALEVLKLLRDRQVLYSDAGVWTVRTDFAESVIPDRVSSLILQRLDQLDTPHRELLELAAVIGPSFTSADLEAVLGTPRLELLKMLYHLERDCRLITSARGTYEFDHGKIREVLYTELSWELRREYHRIAAAVLAQRGDDAGCLDASAMGRHLFFGEEWDRAIPPLRQAADQAYQLFTWRSAAELYDQVAEAARQCGSETDDYFHALRCGGRCYALLAAYERAHGHLAEMQKAAARAQRPLDEAAAWYQLGWLERRQRRFDLAVEAFERAEAVAMAHPGDDMRPVLAQTLTSWGAVDFERGEYAAAEERWRNALVQVQEAAGVEAAGPEAANALNNLAVLATVRGDLDEAWRQYEQVLALDADRPATAQTVLTIYNMGMLRADQERWDEALELFDRSLSLCRERRLLTYEPAIETNRGEALLGRGDLAEARVALSGALRAFRRLDDPVGMADALRLYGRLCRQEQDWDEGRDYLERSVEINREIGESVSLGEALFELGALHSDSGRATDAVDPLREAEAIFTKVQARLDLDRTRQLLEEISVN